MTTSIPAVPPTRPACTARSSGRPCPARAAALVVGALAAVAPVGPAAAQVEPPPTRTVEQVDDYHGVEVADPYRWLEHDVRVDSEVADWVARENAVTFRYLEAIPERRGVIDRLTRLWDYERVSAPFKAGGHYFIQRNDGLQDQSVLYMMDSLEYDEPESEPRLVFDPNTWSADGTVALGGLSASDDGRYLAYGVQVSGSDWRTWKIRDLTTGKDLPEELHWIKFGGVAWTHDGTGFFYGRFPPPAEGAAHQESSRDQRIYHHRAGTPQSRDVLVWERPDQPDWSFTPQVTDDGRWLVISVWMAGPRNLVYVRDLQEPYAAPAPLIGGFDASYSLVGNDGPVLYFQTDLDAPRGRIVAVDVTEPGRDRWRTVVAETEDALDAASLLGDRFVCTYLHDASSRVRLYDLDGAPQGEVDLPGLGSARGFGGRRTDTETFYTFESFATPPSAYRYDLAAGASRLVSRARAAIDPEAYVVEQVFFASADGTRVPMFLCHRKDVRPDGRTPTLLYGYGGFNIAIKPSFSVTKIAWMDMGGLFAVANIRGGGEYGEEWHAAGTRLDKQNVFDDFIAASEWLIESGWTSPERLAISGRSNGGLLVGACMTQRPDLYGACLPAVGVMDMLRFQEFTAGRYWTHDYGSAADPEQFAALRAYSPYHNIREGTAYPATLVTTADTDDRVVPGHSFKFAARLQAAQAGDAPVLIRIETGAGHGSGKPTSLRIAEAADELAFLVENLDMDVDASP